MNVLIVVPTTCRFPGDDAANKSYLDRAFDHSIKSPGTVAVRCAADAYDGTVEGIAKTRSFIQWADVVRMYVDHGKDGVMINIERMAERERVRIETIRITPFAVRR